MAELSLNSMVFHGHCVLSSKWGHKSNLRNIRHIFSLNLISSHKWSMSTGCSAMVSIRYSSAQGRGRHMSACYAIVEGTAGR